MLVGKNIRINMRGEPLLEKVSFVISSSERVALVGSTHELVRIFFELLTGEQDKDEGTVLLEGVKLLYLSPEMIAADGQDFGIVYRERPTNLLINTLSDTATEPTPAPLQTLIKNFRGGIVLASSDPELHRLAKVTRVLELSSITRSLTSYVGSYDSFIVEKEKRDAQMRDAYEKQQREKRRIEEWLELKRKEAAVNRSPERGATIRAKTKYLKREILDKQLPNPHQDETAGE
jgi:ATPase subunit of ABC transporter with duplicated ATPase domains